MKTLNNAQIQYLITQFSKYLLLIIAFLYVVIYLFVVISRINYPFELEWMEGAMVDHVRRILEGRPLYVSPSIEFVPYLYPPLYFYLSAIFSSLIGIGFFPLRLISFISSVGCAIIIYLFVFKETKNYFTSILASCLFIATFRLSGAWFDIARIDSLFLFLLLIALYLVKFSTSTKSYIIAGIFFSLSFFTKQMALIISFSVILYYIFINRRGAFLFTVILILLTGGVTLIFNHIHNGWYNYYLFELPRHHPVVKAKFIQYWIKDIISPFSISVVMSLFFMFIQLQESDKRDFIFYLLIGIGMLGASWIGRIHSGGAENVLFPAYAFISIMFGLSLNIFIKNIVYMSENKRMAFYFFIYLLCILQFTSGRIRYNPFDLIPTQEDLKAGKELISKMSHVKGEIFIPDHGYLPVLAGKRSYAHAMAIMDILRSRESKIKEKMIKDLINKIKNKKFSMIILDGFEPFWKDKIEKYYKRSENIFKDENVFFPVSGIKKRPEYIYLPR